MNRLAKLSARYTMMVGFTIGIGDVYPSAALTAKKQKLVQVSAITIWPYIVMAYIVMAHIVMALYSYGPI